MPALTTTVIAVNGTAFARDANGNLRPLKVGDVLKEGESVVTSAGGRVELAMPDGETFTIGENETVKLSADLSETSRPDAQDAHLAGGTVDQVIEAINQGANLDDVLEAPAAGLAGGAGGEGSSFVRLLRISEDVNPAEFEFDGAATLEVEAVETGAAAAPAQAEVVLPPYAGKVTLSAPGTVSEGGSIIYTATVDNPPAGTPLVLTLSNGAQIIILPGESSGSVQVAAPGDDVYLDGETLTVTIEGGAGGGYDTLDISGSVSLNVADTMDATTVSLGVSPAAITEAGATVTYTATLTHAAEGVVTVSLSNGQTITIADGATSGTIDYTFAADEDVYLDAGSAGVTIEAATGGNFEDLKIDATAAVVTTADTLDPTTVSLAVSPAAITEAGATVTYTATLTHAAEGAVTISLSNGQTIMIADGATSGTVDFTFAADEDVYLDAGTAGVTITGAEGGNFENLEIDATPAVVAIADTLDPTTVSLAVSPAAITEAGATVTYTATLTHAAEGAVIISLSNGQTITITDGATSGTVDFTFAADEDVYLDAGSAGVTIESATGGNFENLEIDATPAVVGIADTLDATTVSISAANVTENDAGVTFSITLSNPPQGMASAQVRVGETTYDVALDTDGVGTLIIPTADPDVYLDADSVTATVTGVTGGNYEAVSGIGASATAQIGDTLDATTVSISAANVTENDAGVTFSITLSNPPQGMASAQVRVGETTYDVALDADGVGTLIIPTADPDVYLDADSVTATVTGVTGGNYEAVSGIGASATAQIADTLDATTVSISAANVTENDAGVTFSITLSNPPQGAASAQVRVGETTYDVALDADGVGTLFVATADPDVYLDADSVTATVTGVTGGNYEAVSGIGASATAQIADTLDPTSVSISATNVTENDAGVTFTIALSNPPQGMASAQVRVGETTYDVALDVDGVGTLFVATADPDVYLDADSVTATVTGVTGGNYEAVSGIGASATAQIADTLDPTTVMLNATAEISETGGTILYTATVDNVPQATPLVLTLSNGAQITIPADGSTGSVAVSLSAAELAAFTDGTIAVSVAAATGGNYEQLDLSDGATTRIDKGVEISDLTSQLDGGDAAVSEANLADGTSPNAAALTQSGNFTIAAPDGVGSLKVAGVEVIANNVFTPVSFTTAFGNTLAFTSYDAATGVLSYTYTLAATADHGLGGRDSVFEDFAVELVDNDGATPESATAVLAVRVVDDAPIAFKPDTSYLVDQEPYTRTVTGELNFDDVGADGLGSVWLSGFTPGAVATDAFGTPLTLDGKALFLYYGDGDDQSVLLAKTAEGRVGIEVHVDTDANTYTLTTYGVIANGVKISVVDLEGVGGGNPAFKALIDIGGSTKDVLMSTKSGESINTNQTEIGISDGQSFKAGELIRYDFVNGVQAVGNGPSKTFTYDGTHNQVSEFRQTITKANGTVNLTVSAILADSDSVFYGDASGEPVLDLTTADVRVVNASGVDVTGSVTLVDNGNSVTIKGMEEGWSFVVSSPVAFTALQVEAAAGTGTFKLGFFSTTQVLPGQPIDLAFGVTGSDADGDTASGSIHTTLYPASLSVEGDESANTLTGGAGTDYVFGYDGDDVLQGAGGNDVLVGGGGADTLTGGTGNDVLVGGLGADVFKWTLAETGTDTVKDFTLGKFGDAAAPNADQLDLRDLLVGENSGTIESYLHVTQAGGNTTVEISSNGGFADGYNAGAVNQTIVLEGVSFDGLNSSSEIISKLMTDGQIKVD